MIINPPSSAALALYASTTTRKTGAEPTPAGSTVGRGDDASERSSDSVSLSSSSTNYSTSIATYSTYFPARSGMGADALLLGVSHPDAVSSSKGMTFIEVANDARKRINEKYALMKDSGDPYGATDTDRNSLMGDLDRRSLYAVATNEGGQFSADEQTAAKSLLRQQERLATGYYSGPTDQEKSFVDPYKNNPVSRAKAALAFLENMSPEEKAAPQWLSQHQALSDALAQTGLDTTSTTNKSRGHFHNLWEILADIDTDGSQSQSSEGAGGSKTNTIEQRKASAPPLS